MRSATLETGIWEFLPPNPQKWLWTRLKLYAAVAGTVVSGFFLIVGLYGCSQLLDVNTWNSIESGNLFAESWAPVEELLSLFIGLVTGGVSFLRIWHEKREMDHEDPHPSPERPSPEL